MASDDEDDLIALRQAALATLKKKPAIPEDAQPIPQLTSSGHSIHNAKSAWTEEKEFAYDDVPFHDHEPVAPFDPLTAPPQFGQNPPSHFDQNRWPGAGPGPRGNFNNNRFIGGRGAPFMPNQRAPLGQNHRPPFQQRMQFNRNHRPGFPGNQRLPFNPRQPPPFGQNRMQFISPSLVSGPAASGGGGGNLILINTLPEEGENRGPQFPRQRHPFNSRRGRGRAGAQAGRGSNPAEAGPGTNTPASDSQSAPVLLRPQDKYCPPADTTASSQQPAEEHVHRKKKDKFSRYDSSGSESDDESEEEEDEQPSRRLSLPGAEEEKDGIGSEDIREDQDGEDQAAETIPGAEISIVAANTSQLDSDKELDEPELNEPVIDNLGEGENESEPELNKEEEEALLASPTRDDEPASPPDFSFGNEEELKQNSADNDATPTRDESPVRGTSSERDSTPVRDESLVRDTTPVRDESPERDISPARDRSSCSPQSRGVDNEDSESGSGSGSESGNESDSSSSGSSSSNSSSSDKEDASQSGSNSNSDVDNGEAERVVTSKSHTDSDSKALVSGQICDSESEDERSVRYRSSQHRISASPKRRRSPSPKVQKRLLTAEEKAKMEARRRKFESGQEVTVSKQNRTISLKGIVSRTKRLKTEQKEKDRPTKATSIGKSRTRIVHARTKVTKSPEPDSHPKHGRRRVSVEKPVHEKSDSNAESKSESEDEEEDDEEGGSRSWMREANKNITHRRTMVDRPLPGSDSRHDGSYGRGGRDGKYDRHRYDSPRDNRPEVHYSSSDNEDHDSDRKMISVVVPRSSAGTRHRSDHPRGERNLARSVVPSRKRTSAAGVVDHSGDRHSVPKSKRFQEFNSGSDGPGAISVVISGDGSSSRRSQSGGNRIPVHQRLGKGSKQHRESSRSHSSVRPVSRNHTDSGSEGEGNSNKNELDQRIRRIQKKNEAIMRRQKEVLKDRELYG